MRELYDATTFTYADLIDSNICLFEDICYMSIDTPALSASSQQTEDMKVARYETVYITKNTDDYVQPLENKLVDSSTKLTVTSIKTKAYSGYYVKGFLVVPDYISVGSTYLHYLLVSGADLFDGLQGNEYFSRFNLLKFISVDYQCQSR